MHMTQAQIDTLMPRLRRRAARLTSNRAEAEDLCQEALLRLWQALCEDREIATPGRYAMIVLHNLARREWRMRVPQAELSDDIAGDAPAGPARLACADLAVAIDALPGDQAALMRMVAMGETSPAFLATQLDVPVGTVMSRLARARKTLRARMGLKHGAPVSELL